MESAETLQYGSSFIRLFGDQEHLRDVVETRHEIMRKRSEILQDPSLAADTLDREPPKTPGSPDHAKALLELNETLRTAVMTNPGTKTEEIAGKKIYRFHAPTIEVTCADPKSDDSLNLGEAKVPGTQIKQKVFTIIHGNLEGYPATLSMGQTPEIVVTFSDILIDGDETTFEPKKKENIGTVTREEATLAAHLLMQALNQAGKQIN